MKIWAIVPVKPFNRAKSRLAKILAPQQREMLAERLFRHSIEVLTATKEIAGVMVISRDTKVLALARDFGAHTVQESGVTDLNPALLRASQVVGAQGADGVLVLPADLPLVSSEDIRQIVHLGRFNAAIVIAPDRHENGTNALLVNPPGYIPFLFGEGSFQKHIESANAQGATVRIYRSEGISLDIDEPDDLERYFQLSGQTLESVTRVKVASENTDPDSESLTTTKGSVPLVD